MSVPELKYFASIRIHVDAPYEVGKTYKGLRRMINITGGEIEGEGWTGRVLPGGADYQVIVTERLAELDARYVLELPEGRVFIQNRAIRVAAPEVTKKLVRGEKVDPSEVYFCCTPTFETAAPELLWMQERIFVGTGVRKPDCVELKIYSLEVV